VFDTIGNPGILGPLILAFLLMIPLCLALLALLDCIKVRLVRTRRRWGLVRMALVSNALLALCAVDAWLIEPGMLTVTRITGSSPRIASGASALKVIQVSDVHFVHRSVLSTKVLAAIEAEKPDLVFLTGDVYQPTGYSAPELSDFLSALVHIAPVYAVTGFDDERVIRSASHGQVHILDDSEETVLVRGTRIRIAGADSSGDAARLKPDPGSLVFLLMHSPDSLRVHMKPDLQPCADWAFAGHTHGGQVRLPFWGAVLTGCYSGKRYEYGQYKIGKANLFVTRGIGLEPKPAPQVRFCCRPEIVVLTLRRESAAETRMAK